ncbi:MAG: cysteine synthase, cysteine synthase B [Candidatus Peregrinibacteria bacterium GW2011_GWF2_38_29]|nr:MAG: cysteine synthase, cysteine synthase B [Candidatus Peregrinibacteria bacterium GW2011_GWF2_38_29]HBB02828.1 cysteine synthase B [Candidatus Peregrinibacteria bacterium]
MKYSNLLQTIGNTPMIKLEKILDNKNVNLFAKLEGQNPGGSIKDRAALYMIEQAEKSGELKKGKIILEATSGNMGIALAMIGAQKGYEVQIVMSEGMSEERKTMLKALGAKLILTDKSLGTGGAINKAKELAESAPFLYWFSNQFNNQNNVLAHYHGVAGEILNEVSQVDYLIAGIGTSGTIIGIASRFKKDSPKTKIIGVFPPGGYKIQGLQNPEEDFKGDIYKSELIDEQFQVSKEDAFEMARKVAKKEGLFVGMSSGAALFAANEISKSLESANIVVIIPDRGEKYLSTELFAKI